MMDQTIGTWWSTTVITSSPTTSSVSDTSGTVPTPMYASTTNDALYTTESNTLLSSYYNTLPGSSDWTYPSTVSFLTTVGSSLYSNFTNPSTLSLVTPNSQQDGRFGNESFLNDTTTLVGASSLAPDFADDHNIYIMPLYQQFFWTFVFASMVLVAAGGNMIVIWIVLHNKRMRTVTNYFLVNLSLADIMVSTLNVIFNFIYMLHSHWPFGQAYCKISNFIAILSVAASVFTLMAISIDRYLAIVHPLRPRMSRRTTLNIIVIVWIASSVLALPNILYSTTINELFANGDARVVCYLEWHDGPSNKSKIEYVYNILIMLVTYMLPIVSMIYTYFRVGRELWGSQSIGECTAKQMESIKSKRKIVKMMMIVVAIFGICWAPYHLYFLLAHHYPAINDSAYAQHFYLGIYWLAMSNSMYNPFVYCWMNSRFRQGFRNAFCCVCCRPKEAARLYEMPRAYHLAARFTSNAGSEGGLAITSDTRVRFNGNGNAVTLQPSSCADLAVMSNTVTSGTSGTSSLASRFPSSAYSREML